jgi:cytochrome c oxidase cbb3-type subunit 2
MKFDTDHRLIVGCASGIFLLLSLFIAVLPALEAERTPAFAGIEPLEGDEALGRKIYLQEGCGVCHTQFVRDLPVDEQYGRGSLAGDYALEDPPLLGTQRTGPDLSNVGRRQPSEVWNLIHLYNPRAVVPNSVMPAYPWMFTHKSVADDSDTVVTVPPKYNPKGAVIVANTEAIALVRYLQTLKQVEVGP